MFKLVFLAFLATSIFGVAPACAQGRPVPRRDVQRLDKILPGIASRYPGTFYDAEGPFEDEDGGLHYRLKWMTPEGRIIWLDTDARTGRVFGVQQGYPRREHYAPRAYAPPPGAYPEPRGHSYSPRGYYGGGPGEGRWNGGGYRGGSHGNRGGPGGDWSGHGNGHHGG